MNFKTKPMKKNYLLIAIAFLFFFVGYSQSKFPPVSIEQGTFLGESIPLRDFPRVQPVDPEDYQVIPNNLRNAPKMNPDALPVDGDPLATQNPSPTRSPNELLQSWDGLNISQSGGAVPPDPSGAVGPNHYVHAVNLAVIIYDKTGTILEGPVSLGAFFGNGVNNGDPIVMYDQLADRWFVSQFIINTNSLIIAVSTSPDPTDTYYIYEFALNNFPDYPHYAVWPNAYFMTANKSGGLVAYALERDKMLAGASDASIIGFGLPGLVRNPNTVFSPEFANLLGTDHPADVPGYVVYLQDDAWSVAITEDHIKLWTVEVDFDAETFSVSAPEQIVVAPFDSTFHPFGTGDVEQPGTPQDLDNLGGIISYMANYRSFDDHNSFIFNFNVNLGGFISGIRWIELRNVGTGPFSLYQEGTHTYNDGLNRFMGSMAMDINGNIALAYNTGSSSEAIGIKYTGRLAGDPLGSMSFQEQEIQAPAFYQTYSNRFGDYAQMTMDPDGVTFWHTAEYIKFINNWHTKIAAFNLENIPLGVDDIDGNDSSLEVYPLGDGTYEITFATTQSLNSMQFEVIEMQGKKVSQGILNDSSNGFKGTFSSANLSSGIYIVKVFNNNMSQSKKLIIK